MPLWVLGASDNEMSAIENLLVYTHQPVAYALAVTGVRVHPGNAYVATGVFRRSPAPRIDEIIEVECHVADPTLTVVDRCDHHRPGDPGHGLGPADFLPASSIGQVIAKLAKLDVLPWSARMGARVRPRDGEFQHTESGWQVSQHGRWVTIPQTLVLTAAADHCPAAAYAGQCPGVDPADLYTFRLTERAAWLAQGPGGGRDAAREDTARAAGAHPNDLDRRDNPVVSWLQAVETAAESTARILAEAPVILLAGTTVRDLRGHGTLPELPEVLSRGGVAAIYRMTPPPGARDLRVKVGIIGGGEGSIPGSAPVAAFLSEFAPRIGLVDLYGDPIRGYAGGYEP